MQAILHADRNWGIGKGGGLMFRLPLDMAYFKEKTLGKTVVMGSGTLLSLPGGKPLKGRENIVLWPGGDKDRAERMGYVEADGLDELFALLKKRESSEVFVIGGAMMYRTMLPYCSDVLVTKVDADGEAEVFFPDLDKEEGWSLAEEGEERRDGDYSIRFCRYSNASPLPL